MIYFEKYHGTGNDFIILNGLDHVYKEPSKLAKLICDRHFGIGADGMMIVGKSPICSVKMDFFNSDGTLAPMCGNGIRCFTKYVYEQGIVNKPEFSVETVAGVIPVAITKLDQSGMSQVRVNLGKPLFDLGVMGVNSDEKDILDKPLYIGKRLFSFSVVTMGTLHSVVFVPKLDDFPVDYYGNLIENLPLFPQKTNVNFVEIVDEKRIKLRTYERGVGQTLSCGTGAAASAVICHKLKGLASQIYVQTKGGELFVEHDGDDVFLTGPAVLIGKGYFNEIKVKGGGINEKA